MMAGSLLPNRVARCEITILFWYPDQSPQAPDRGTAKAPRLTRPLRFLPA